jgi:hypothetical protein
MGTSGPCEEVDAGVTTPPAGLTSAMICGDGTDVNARLGEPLAVAAWLRVTDVLPLIALIVVPDGTPEPLTGSPTASSLVPDTPTVVEPLVTVPGSVTTVPGTGTLGEGRAVVVVKVYSAVPAVVLELNPSARVDLGWEPKPKTRAATITVKGAGQRRITTSLLLELRATHSIILDLI